MKIKPPYTGLVAFLTVLFTMPLGHAAMILMEKGFGHHYIYHAALLLIITMREQKKKKVT